MSVSGVAERHVRPATPLAEVEPAIRSVALAGAALPPRRDPPGSGLTEGRMVHFVLDGGPNMGEHRPAVVVKLWQPGGGPAGIVQLQVFTDGANDGAPYAAGIVWRTSVRYDAFQAAGTWHWIEHVA